MNEELMITQQDLIDWLDRPPSNDDLDLATFISTRLKNFYKLEQQLQQKENIIKEVREYIEKHCKNERISNEVGYACYTMADTNELEHIMKILDKGEDKE